MVESLNIDGFSSKASPSLSPAETKPDKIIVAAVTVCVTK